MKFTAYYHTGYSCTWVLYLGAAPAPAPGCCTFIHVLCVVIIYISPNLIVVVITEKYNILLMGVILELLVGLNTAYFVIFCKSHKTPTSFDLSKFPTSPDVQAYSVAIPLGCGGGQPSVNVS